MSSRVIQVPRGARRRVSPAPAVAVAGPVLPHADAARSGSAHASGC
jgi:hypothetical protein